jgi:hypothetical protein
MLPVFLAGIPARGGMIFKNSLEFDQLSPNMATEQGKSNRYDEFKRNVS